MDSKTKEKKLYDTKNDKKFLSTRNTKNNKISSQKEYEKQRVISY